ncbi:hypothetical protein BX600DRAFT_433386 [Xylariales sp. PMI_506]|nr:hypothetical protein BX600DRAFT_433386 [Xylariales sp. PMI_506]
MAGARHVWLDKWQDHIEVNRACNQILTQQQASPYVTSPFYETTGGGNNEKDEAHRPKGLEKRVNEASLISKPHALLTAHGVTMDIGHKTRISVHEACASIEPCGRLPEDNNFSIVKEGSKSSSTNKQNMHTLDDLSAAANTSTSKSQLQQSRWQYLRNSKLIFQSVKVKVQLWSLRYRLH